MKHVQITDELYEYLLGHSVKEHAVLQKIRNDNADDHLTSIMQIAPEQGQYMAFMIKLSGAKQVLEIGTSTGYSSLAMALALPLEGRLVTCDINEAAGNKAQQYWQEAGLEYKIQLKLAPALETLAELINEGKANFFDLVFIDADKTNYNAYFEMSLTLLREGGLILIDNVLWGGAVVDKTDTSKDTAAICALNEKLYCDKRIDMCMLPLADGLSLVRKK